MIVKCESASVILMLCDKLCDISLALLCELCVKLKFESCIFSKLIGMITDRFE